MFGNWNTKRKIKMKDDYNTERLVLRQLNQDDTQFISILVNMPEWIRFIGDRNIHSKEDAEKYISKILADKNIKYWVVRLNEKNNPIGIITFIKRDYLDFPDIGFAFLGEYTKQGYAFEAATVVLQDAIKQSHDCVLATTIRENSKSIRLLEKLGFRYDRQIEVNNETISVYSFNTED